MRNKKWIFRSLVEAFIGIPLRAQFLMVLLLMAGEVISSVIYAIRGDFSPGSQRVLVLLLFILGCVGMFIWGRNWAGDIAAENRKRVIFHRFLFLAPSLLLLLFPKFLLFPWLFVVIVSAFNERVWLLFAIIAAAHCSFTLGYWLAYRRQFFTRSMLSWRNIWPCAVLILVPLAPFAAYQSYLSEQRQYVRERINMPDFNSASWNNGLTPLRGQPEFKLSQNFPRMDGASAAYPLYASAFNGLSTHDERKKYATYLGHSRTPNAYQNIIEGEADIIFVAQPSGGQKKHAQKSGVTLTLTPFAQEAFVFIVNADNPVNSLTEQQVRDIFSGAITNWRSVGGDDTPIQSWQRPEDSGSQTAMLSLVMKDTQMIPAQKEKVETMGGMINVVSEYRNTHQSIGYTFRYYATQMNANKNIKLLAINGIAPTVENIRNGTYPYVMDAYMVTRDNPTAETQKLVDWFLAPQGQALVEDVGYVPIYKTLAPKRRHIWE